MNLGLESTVSESDTMIFTVDDGFVNVPDASFVTDSVMSRDGADLVLKAADGQIRIEGYFNAEEPPVLQSEGGLRLDYDMVQSFLSAGDEYAQVGSLNDESPVGLAQEVKGEVVIERVDGSIEVLKNGMPIYEGDVVETKGAGAVNLVFVDETQLAISDGARLAIDEYVFDASTNEGTTDFSVLKGIFVFTSGLIGREDPDDVNIDTPMGSIGIRGTQILGNVDTGEITVTEGAIVLRDFGGNEVTLDEAFETAVFKPGAMIEEKGVLESQDVLAKFSNVQDVAGDVFSSYRNSDDQPGNDARGDDAQPVQPAEPQDSAPEGEQNGLLEPQEAPIQLAQLQHADVVAQYANDQLRAGQVRNGAGLAGDTVQNANAVSTPDSSQLGDDIRDLRGQDDSVDVAQFWVPQGDQVQGDQGGQADFAEGAAPLNYFKLAAVGGSWAYNFSNQFYNVHNDITKYDLDISQNGSVVYSHDDIPGVSNNLGTFLSTAGFYDVVLNGKDSSGNVVESDVRFQIEAVMPDYEDSSGQMGNIVNPGGGTFFTVGAGTTDTNLYFGTATQLTLLDSGKTVFSNASSMITNIRSDNNYFYGNDSATNTVNIGPDVAGNTVFGGRDADIFTFDVNNPSGTRGDNNTIYGLDGDDIIKIQGNESSSLQKQSESDNANNKIANFLFDGGNGRDTLSFEGGSPFDVGGGDTLDFSKLGGLFNQIKNIEVIDLNVSSNFGGNGDGEKVILRFEDVFDIASEEYDHMLTIKAEDDDAIELHGDWDRDDVDTYDEFGNDAGNGFYKYDNGEVSVLVQAEADPFVAVIP